MPVLDNQWYVSNGGLQETKAFVQHGRFAWPIPPLASSPRGSAYPITAYTKSL